MSSDAIISYTGKLLAILSLAVLFTMGYSAYALLPSLYAQHPKIGFNETHVTIGGIGLRNEGMYPIRLTLKAKFDGKTYSDSVDLGPGEAKELKLTLPISAIEKGNISLTFEMVPFLKARIELPKESIMPHGELEEGG